MKPNENYIVRKLNNSKLQISRRGRLHYEQNTIPQENRPESSLQSNDGVANPQDDICVIT